MSRRLRVGLMALASALLICGAAGATAATAAPTATKTVHYHGYSLLVPTTWPVFDLSMHPSTCVRFHRHALYLGRPATDQRCPPHSVGRTEAILVQPLSAHAGGAGPILPSVTAAAPPRGSATTLTRRGLLITATWSTQQALIKRALGVSSLPAAKTSMVRARQASAPTAHAASAPNAHAASVFTGLGFDACTAPSGSQMSAWGASPYRAIGVYIGGTNMGCSQPNLTAAWVSAETAAGWHFIPTYVGLQAPSNGCGCASINPGSASAEGIAAATDAVNQARALGIGGGSPIYFDMEAYSTGGTSTTAVLNFLAAWTSHLHALGYTSGVYSSGASGIRDLARKYGSGYLEPDDLWVADWNAAHTTSDPYVPANDWASHQRIHQYSGDHSETYRHVTLDIDGDYLDGATTGSRASLPDGTFVQVAGTASTYRIAGGAPLYVSSWSDFGGPQPYTVITPQQFAQLNPVPRGGTFLQTTNGDYYRVAGGAPLFIDNLSQFTSPHPITIDQWDIDNAGTALSHLYSVPRNGTYVVTTTGRMFRVAGGAPFTISSWSVFGGPQPSVKIDQWDIDNITNPLAHLNASPADGTLVEGLPSHTYWSFTAAHGTLIKLTASATAVDDVGLAGFGVLVPKCVVPYLKHKTLSQVKAKLRDANCRLGRVRRIRRPSGGHRLHVIRQSPRARTTHIYGYRVAITLG